MPLEKSKCPVYSVKEWDPSYAVAKRLLEANRGTFTGELVIQLSSGGEDPAMFDALARLYELGMVTGRSFDDSLCVADLQAHV